MSVVPDFELLGLTLKVVGGRRYWILPLLPLAWLAFQGGVSLINGQGFAETSAQGVLIGLPLTLLAVFLGIRIIAGEIDERSLEIAYTVPGGCERVWWAKLLAALVLLLLSEALLAVATYVFFTPFPLVALYGAMQAACFYLVLATATATLFRSEAAGAMGAVAVLGFNGLISGFGESQIRISPFFNPAVLEDVDPSVLFAWTLQNRVGMLLAMAAILSLAFMRANRRERMLGG